MNKHHLYNLKQIIKKLSSKNWFIFVILALGMFILNHQVFVSFWTVISPAGNDTSSHAALGQYYAEHIFPLSWGWIPNWYGGMPFPQFYPPLFYFLTAFFFKILPFISYITVFKTVISVIIFLFPGLMAWFTRQQIASLKASWLVGIITLLSMSTGDSQMNWGINIGTPLSFGLVPQFCGSFFLLFWLNYFLKAEFSRKSAYYSVFFLFFVFLSNATVVQVAFLVFVVTVTLRIFEIITSRKTHELFPMLGIYFVLGSIPLLLASFWYFPLIFNYKYLVTVAVNLKDVDWSILKFSFLVEIFFTLCALAILKYKKKVRGHFHILIVACVALIIPISIYLNAIFTSLPIQTFRWASIVLILSLILVGYVAIGLSHFFTSRKAKTIIFILCIFPFFTAYISGLNYNRFYYFFFSYGPEQFSEILSYLKGKQGIIDVELARDPITISNENLTAFLGRQGNQLNYINMRESSISSLFRIPVMNSLSDKHETWGIKSYLTNDPDFYSQQFDTKLERAKDLGIQYFLVRSRNLKDQYSSSTEVSLLKNFSPWQLYSFNKEIGRADVLLYKPILLLSPLTFKDRKIDDYDYVRIQEELFFHNYFDKLTFVRPTTIVVDDLKNIDDFGSIFITAYHYNNFDKAYSFLEEYSRNHYLILIADSNPLFKKLASLDASHHIKIYDRLKSTPERPNPLRAQLNSIFNAMLPITPLVAGTEGNSIQKTDFTGNHIKLTINSTGVRVPVLIRASYFPNWRSNNGEPIYIATPTFMLTFASSSSLSLEYTPDTPIKVGFIISGIGLFISIGILLWHKRYKNH